MKYTGRTTYSLENLRAFQKMSSIIRGRRQYLFSRGSYAAAGIIFSAMAIWAICGIPSSSGSDRFWNMVIAALGVWMAFQMLYTAITYFDFFARRALRSIPADAHENFFSFEEDHLVVSNRTKSWSFRYGDMVDTVYETEQYFLLFIGWRNGYVLEKSGIDGGDVDGLRSFLSRKLKKDIPYIEL